MTLGEELATRVYGPVAD